MRITRLVLERYGAFADRAIDLGPGLTLVLGPNETGKSTALDALADLLWSIPQQSGRAFRYPRKELRVGARVLLGGVEHEVARTASGLVGFADGGGDEPWRGDGDDRARWLTSFGLSHEMLRLGGQDLFEAKGDLAALVFRARSGRSVHRLLDELTARADALYKQHRGSRSVVTRQALERYLEVDGKIAGAMADATQVRRAEEDVAALARRAETAAVELREAEAGHAGAAARVRVAETARRLAATRRRVAELHRAGAFLGVEGIAAWSRATERLEKLAGVAEDLAREVGETGAERDAVLVDEALLADAEPVGRLYRDHAARLDDAQRAEGEEADAEAADARARVALAGLVEPGEVAGGWDEGGGEGEGKAAGRDEGRSAGAGPADARVADAGWGDVEQAGAEQVGAVRADVEQAGTGQAGVEQADARQVSAGQTGAGWAGAERAGVGHANVGQANDGQANVGQASAEQANARQASAGQAGTGQAGAGLVGLTGAGRTGADRAGGGVRSVAELLAGLWVGDDRAAELDVAAEALDDAEARLAERARDLDGAEEGVEPLDVPDDAVADAVREVVAAVEGPGSAFGALRQARQDEADAERERVSLLAAVGLAADALDGVSAVPSAEAVRVASGELLERRGALADASRLLEEGEKRVAALVAQLADAATGDVPDPGAVADARAERDALLARALGAWLAGTAPAGEPELPVALERAVAGADRIADRVAADREAAGRRAVLVADHRHESAEVERCRGALEAAAEAERDAGRAWDAVWAGVAAPLPQDGGAFRERLAGALDAAGRAGVARARAEVVAVDVERQRGYLAGVLADAGRPRPDADLESLLVAARTVVDEHERARAVLAVARERRAVRERALQDLDRLREVRDDAAGHWLRLLGEAGLADMPPVRWQRRREVVERAREEHRRAEAHRSAAEVLRRRCAEFAAELSLVAARHGVPDGAGAAEELAERVAAARDGLARVRGLDERLDRLAGRVAEVEAERGRLTALLDGLRAEHDDDLDAAAARGRELVELAEDDREHRAVISAALPDVDVDDVVEEIAGTDDEALGAAARVARVRYDEAVSRHQEVRDRLAETRVGHQELLSRPGAAELHARAGERLAEVADRVEDYVVVEIQRRLLRRELEAYERKHASPLLEAAGRLLERLTEGRYVALRTHQDRSAALAVVGADERERSPQELSEGTADQVFLALRLAGIASLQRERAGRGLPVLPVVLDDVLMTFDDARAGAALRVMAGLAEEWQVIVLSHHGHLRDVAGAVDGVSVAELSSAPELEVARSAEEVRDAVRQAAPAPVGAVRAVSPKAGGVNVAAVREWARANGRQVADRGRIPADVVEAYELAHR
ncbi:MULTISPECIES: histone-like nucleoid-structuring protein Lsr2 [Actinosynnema]|uniref:AAA family ATPase n=1 Tax=Actinosynnema TaxID=40566 RepID=UPI0026462A3E|nr:Lsr2 protein [Actinosynnema pretiosum]